MVDIPAARTSWGYLVSRWMNPAWSILGATEVGLVYIQVATTLHDMLPGKRAIRVIRVAQAAGAGREKRVLTTFWTGEIGRSGVLLAELPWPSRAVDLGSLE